jgi:hypothetical protein
MAKQTRASANKVQLGHGQEYESDDEPEELEEEDESVEEDESEEESEEEEADGNGAKIVAMLCRPKKGKGKPLEIAVVVSAENRDDARSRAQKYIDGMLHDQNWKIKCDRVDKPSQPKVKSGSDGSDILPESDGDADDTGECDNEETDENIDGAKPVDDAPAQEQLVPYEPADLLASYKGKGVHEPLGGGLTKYETTSALNILKRNYKELMQSKNDDIEFKSTWLVMHPDNKEKTASLSDYPTIKNNKAVVVVLSKMFFVPSNKDRITVNEQILVCNVPYFQGKRDKETASYEYKSIFKQIGLFFKEYNLRKDEKDKITIIAVSYPNKSFVTDSSTTEGVQTRSTKGGSRGRGKGSPEVVDHNIAIWLNALLAVFNTEKASKCDIRLMYEEKPTGGIWHAPENVKTHFEKNIISSFPSCVDISDETNASGTVIRKADLKNTLFVCDLLQKNRVGNNNDGETTGGVFGSFVPMHYTAVQISGSRFSNANEINGLIDVIYTNSEIESAAKASHQKGADAPRTSKTAEKPKAAASDAQGPAKHVAHNAHAVPSTSHTNVKTEETGNKKIVVSTASSVPSKEERAALIAKIEPIYGKNWEDIPCVPPEWIGKNYIEEFDRYAHEAKLFVDAGADLELAKLVASQREPVNMGYEQCYNKKEMQSNFGYSESLYGRHYEAEKKLAPNIGVLTICPVNVDGKKQEEAMIYHAIGAALDSARQADYKEFMPKGEANVTGLIKFYVSVFEKIFVAAKQCNAEGVVMSLVGGDAFAKLYPGGAKQMHQKVWNPAFENVWGRHKGKMKLALMGGNKATSTDAGIYLTGLGAEDAGMYPSLVPKYEKWLLVNAWDCHTIPGNGNEGDNTLDGYIGRTSAIQYFGWGIANPLLLENIVRVKVPLVT